jgi:hypothetical protein
MVKYAKTIQSVSGKDLVIWKVYTPFSYHPALFAAQRQNDAIEFFRLACGIKANYERALLRVLTVGAEHYKLFVTPFCGNFLQLTRAMLVLTTVENHISETVEIVGLVGKEFELSIPLQLDFVLNP